MKQSGGCHCGQFRFETDLDPMLKVQCNCSSCRLLTGSMTMGMWYAEDEFTFKGKEVFYEYEGGSGGWMKQGFCPKCHTRVSTRLELMEGVVGIPLGCFDNALQFDKLQVEIWTSEKLHFIKDHGSFEMSVEDSGMMERLQTLLVALEDR